MRWAYAYVLFGVGSLLRVLKSVSCEIVAGWDCCSMVDGGSNFLLFWLPSHGLHAIHCFNSPLQQILKVPAAPSPDEQHDKHITAADYFPSMCWAIQKGCWL